MSNTVFSIITIAIIALVTIALRFAPFAIFRGSNSTPKVITYLGKVLPYAIMGMLVVYCLKGTDFTGQTHGIPEVVASLIVIGLHAWKKNTLLSIIAGTAAYMFMVQILF